MVATQKWYKIASLSLAASGSSLFLLYLRILETAQNIVILSISVLLMAVGAFLSYKLMESDPAKNKLYFVLILTILSLSLNLVPTARFRVFSGLGSPDSLQEYFVAELTLQHSSWTKSYGVLLEGRPNYYFSCLSITIFPAVFSEVTGLDLFQVFEFIYPIIFSLIPILVFLTIDELLQRTELAALSAILYLEMYRFSAPQHGRQYTAILFLILTCFVILKKRNISTNVDRAINRKYQILLFVFGFAVVFSHYTVGYFFLVISLAMFLAPHLPKIPKSTESVNLLNITTVGSIAVLCFSWWFFFNFGYVIENVLVVEGSILEILGIVEARPFSGTRVPGRTSGTIVTGWYVLETALIVIGFFLAYSGKKKNRRFSGWILVASVLFVIFLFSLVIPEFNSKLGFNRVFSISLLFWVPFLAYSLSKIPRKSKSWLLAIFLILNLPMNLSLLTYDRMVVFSPTQDVAPDLAISQPFTLKSEFLMSKWAQLFLQPNQTVSVDVRGAQNMFLATALGLRLVNNSRFASGTHYLALHKYNTEYELWWSTNISKTTDVAEIIANSTVAYNNGESLMLVR